MTSAKAIQIGKDLDTARCNGNWMSVPELARRYKKYNTEGAVLEQTVLAEMNLIQIINNTRSLKDYQQDDPYHITLEDRLDPTTLQSIQSQLYAAIQLQDPNQVNTAQKEFTKVILARTYFESGDYQKAIEIISQLSFEKEQVSQGYGLVLFVQARSIKAMSFDLLDNEEEAIQNYEGVVSLLNENMNVRHKTMVEWAEDTLYRAILLGLRQNSSVRVCSLLEFMRQYQNITRSQIAKWRIQKRMIITRQSLSYCSQVYRQGDYCLPSGATDTDMKDPVLKQQFFIVEQSQLHTIYEKMLHAESPLPKAGQVNTRVLDFVNQFADDFELIGTTAYDLRGFVEILDRASQKTFNSPLITRHLFLALVRLGEFDEAEHALHAYLYLVGLVSYGWKETRRDGKALATDKTGLNIAVPDINEEQDDTANFRSSENENIKDTLHVLMTAMKMYNNDLRRGVDAVEIAEIAKQILSPSVDIEAEVYRAIGCSFGLLGCQTFDPDLRPQYHEKALGYLEKALALDPESWETYYQLALQQAEMRNIGQAVQSITRAIQRNPRHISLWHLLTLLISCPVQGDFKQALKTCEMGMQQALDNNVEGDGVLLNSDDYEKAFQQMMYQMTRTLLLNTLQGVEVALTSSEILFASFRKVAIPELSTSTHSEHGGAHNGMIISGSLGNLGELQYAAEQRRRGKSVSSGAPSHPDAASRSQDSMNRTLVTGRARSTSNLSANPSPLGGANRQLLAVPDSDNKAHHHHHLHGLHLFGSRSSSNRKEQQQLYGKGDTTNGSNSNQSLPVSPYDAKMNASATSIQSLSPSTMSTQSILQPNYIPTKPSTRTFLRKHKSDQVLSDLWLLTARMFIKLGKLGEAHKAIEEAEGVDWTGNPQVWCVLGELLQKEQKHEEAQAAFQKALVIDPHDISARLELAKTYIQHNNQEIAEGILHMMTKSNAWDCAEAWFQLGEIYRQSDRLERTKACLFYALELESTTPIQPFSVLPRYL